MLDNQIICGALQLVLLRVFNNLLRTLLAQHALDSGAAAADEDTRTHRRRGSDAWHLMSNQRNAITVIWSNHCCGTPTVPPIATSLQRQYKVCR